MAAEHRKLLEQLMGEASMNGAANSRNPQVPITDPKVCRPYLVGTCVHDRFINTKGDLGPCGKIHSEALKTQYEQADAEQKERWGFEYDYMRDMELHVKECDRKIDTAQRRLEKTPEEIRQTNEYIEEIKNLTETIKNGMLEIKVLNQTDIINFALSDYGKLLPAYQRKGDIEDKLRSLADTGGPSGHQKLQVCDVCGAYLSRLDNDRRLADHFYGKMHLGYAQMRKTLDELKKQWEDRPPPARSAAPPRSSESGSHAYGGGRGAGRGGRGRGRGGYGSAGWR